MAPLVVDTLTRDGALSVRAVLDAVARLDEVAVARAWAKGSPERVADVSRAVASLSSRSCAASIRAAQLAGIA